MRYIPVIFGVVLFIYGFIDCIRSEPADVRSIPKPAWLLVIILLPLVGVLLWFFLGRPQYSTSAPVPRGGSTSGPQGSPRPLRPTHSGAPDDDPAFLRNLEVTRTQKLEAERLRRLKAELDAREAKLREEHPNDDSKH